MAHDHSNDTIGRWNEMNDMVDNNNIESDLEMAKNRIHRPPVRRKSASIPPDVPIQEDESKNEILNNNVNETAWKSISKDKTGDFDMAEIETNKTMSKQQISENTTIAVNRTGLCVFFFFMFHWNFFFFKFHLFFFVLAFFLNQKKKIKKQSITQIAKKHKSKSKCSLICFDFCIYFLFCESIVLYCVRFAHTKKHNGLTKQNINAKLKTYQTTLAFALMFPLQPVFCFVFFLETHTQKHTNT